MKQIVTLLLITLSTTAFAQERLNKVSHNPLQLFVFNLTNFEYERGFKDGSLGVALYYGRTGSTTREINGISFYGTEQNVTFKLYRNLIDNSGLWWGGRLAVASGNARDGNEGSATGIGTLSVSGMGGYQIIAGSFYLDFFAGLGFALTNDLFGRAHYSGSMKESRILIPFGVKVGFVF